MLGDVGCAASPRSTTRPRTHESSAISSIGEMDRVEAIELTEDARHWFGEVSKEHPELNRIAFGGILAREGREIRVAVQTIRPDRHRQECPPRAEHDRPGVNRAGEIDKESPAHLAKMPWRDVAKQELSNQRMDSVGADDEVIRASRTIYEHHVDLVILLTQPGHRRAEAHADADSALEKNDEAHHERCQRRDRPDPYRCQFDFRQPSSVVIQDSLV